MVNRNILVRGLLLSSCLGALAMGAPAHAQDAAGQAQASAAQDDSGIADIVVTARRSEENVQRVPLAITAVSDQALTDANVRDVKDLQLVVPNLYVSSITNGGRAEFTIRGQRGLEGTLTSDEPIGVYIDEVNYPRVYGLRSAFFDVERVEVLKGPQGTLFGKNNTGGAVSMITKRPYMDWGGYADLTIGSFGTVEFQGAVNAPIAEDKLAARVATSISRRDGYGKSFIGQKLGDNHVDAFRGHLYFTPSDDVSLLISGDYIAQRNNGSPVKIINVRPLSNPGSLQVSRVLPIIIRDRNLGPVNATTLAQAQAIFESYVGTQPGADYYDDYSSLDRYDNVTLWGLSSTLKVAIGSVDFKSITAFRSVDRASAFDYDGMPFVFVDNTFLADRAHNFSQEIQFSSMDGLGLDWIFGFYYNRETGHEDSYTPINDLTAPGLSNINDGDVTNDNQSVFGQAVYHLGQQFRITGGLRYTREGRALVSRNRSETGTCTVPANQPGVCQANFKTSFEYASYLLSLDWRPSNTTMLYINTSRAQRSGGFPLRGGSNVATFEAFKPEQATNYEFGVKTDLLGRHLRINGAVFYTDYRDVQKSANVYTAAGLATILRNAASAEIYGAEIEITAIPVNGLTLTASGGWTHARYTSFNDAVLGDLSGRPFTVPEYTVSLGAAYEVPTSFGSIRANVNYRWTDEIQFRPEAYQPEFNVQKPFSLVDARLTVNFDNLGLDVSVFGKNLTDTRYYNGTSAFDASYGYNIAFLAEPRVIGLQIRKSFGAE